MTDTKYRKDRGPRSAPRDALTSTRSPRRTPPSPVPERVLGQPRGRHLRRRGLGPAAVLVDRQVRQRQRLAELHQAHRARERREARRPVALDAPHRGPVGERRQPPRGTCSTTAPCRTGGLRYCINSAALRFVPVDELESQGYGEYRSLFTRTRPDHGHDSRPQSSPADVSGVRSSALRQPPGRHRDPRRLTRVGTPRTRPTATTATTPRPWRSSSIPTQISYRDLLEFFFQDPRPVDEGPAGQRHAAAATARRSSVHERRAEAGRAWTRSRMSTHPASGRARS